MILERAHEELGWPSPHDLFQPKAEPLAVSVDSLRLNVERSLALRADVPSVRVGVLPTTRDETEAPLALVCDFGERVSEAALLEAHRLAWNYSRTNLLVTAEPGLIRAWTCCERPAVDRYGQGVGGGLGLRGLVVAEAGEGSWDEGGAAELHWSELVTGRLFRNHAERFKEPNRAHVTLLKDLRAVRRRLKALGLANRYTHRLLARLIFVQFLFDRKDSDGHAALDGGRLKAWHFTEDLEQKHVTMADVLQNPRDTYALFRKLDGVFSGDLFDADELAEEEAHVSAEHLGLLARFVRGDIDFESGQMSLWRTYAFDVIPLDLLSSVYETFVEKEEAVGVHYTPTHVADLLLDRVLPWAGDAWNLRVLDPACGSGIFLVKAFQRLMHRWRRAHPHLSAPRASDLRRLLGENLVGVDRDEDAVRVAAFSLYLAMCDQIEPRYVINEDGLFPPLRGRTLHPVDFFDEGTRGIRTDADAGTFDLVVGNPPYGSGTLSNSGRSWAAAHGWPTVGTDGGALFVAKAGRLAQVGGQVAMVQSAPALMYNSTAPARRVQKAVFGEAFRVEGVTLLPPRLRLFKNVKYPACVVFLRNEPADGGLFPYECIKRQWTERVEVDDKIRFVRDPDGVHWLTPAEVLNQEEPWIWSVLAWGGTRDLALIRHLQRTFPTVDTLKREGVVSALEGLKPGHVREREELIGRRELSGAEFPAGPFLTLDGSRQPIVTDAWAGNHSTATDAYELPQLVVKTSWVQSAGRFQARRVVNEPVVPLKTFDSVSGPVDVIAAANVAYNSLVGTYFLFLTSGRVAIDRSEPTLRELRGLPLPLPAPGLGDAPLPESIEALDALAFELYGLVGAERTLVEDAVAYTLDDFKGSAKRGRRPTARDGGAEPHLTTYGEAFRRVMGVTYGARGRVSMRVLAERASRLPVRLVRFTIGPAADDRQTVEYVSVPELRGRLSEAYREAREDGDRTFRVARVYEVVDVEGLAHVTVTIIKPDELRYWTRSEGLRDADRFAAEVAAWSSAAAGRDDPEPVLAGE